MGDAPRRIETSAGRLPIRGATRPSLIAEPSSIATNFTLRHAPLLITLGLLSVLLTAGQSRDSLWLDEQHTAWTIRDGLSPVIDRARMGNNSPLYFVLPWASTQLFGWNELALRLPSLVCGLLLPACVYVIAFRWTGQQLTAFAAGCLACIDPHQLFYSLEARTFSLVSLVGLLQIVNFVQWFSSLASKEVIVANGHDPTHLGRSFSRSRVALEGQPSPVDSPTRFVGGLASEREANRSLWVWVSCTILLFHLHYTTIILPVAEILMVVAVAILVPQRHYAASPGLGLHPTPFIRDRTKWAIAVFLVAAALAPALPHVASVYRRREAWTQFVPIPDAFDLVRIFPVATYVGIPLAFLAVSSFSSRTSPAGDDMTRRRIAWRLLCVGGIFSVAIAVAWLVNRLEIASLFYRRYLMAVSSCGFLLNALVLSLIDKPRWRVAAVVTTCLSAIACGGTLDSWRNGHQLVARSREDWRAAIEFLQECEPLPVAIQSGLIEAERLHDSSWVKRPLFLEFCSLPLLGMYAAPDWAIPPHPQPCSDVFSFFQTTTLSTASEFWLVVRGNSNPEKEPILPAGDWMIQSTWNFGNVTVLRLVRGP